MEPGDIIIDGNSYYKMTCAVRDPKEKGIHYIDVGTSGRVWELERGYCLMIAKKRER